MSDARPSTTPRHYWAVSVLGLLWNCFGAYLYMMARLDPDAAMTGASPAMREYIAHMPLWANVGYGFGIWGSFFGSVAMVLRSRFAVPLFLVSFAGAALSHLGQALAGVLPLGLTAVIMVVIAALWWYSRRAATQGILR